MPGLVPGIHIYGAESKVVDGRVKPGHDELGLSGPQEAPQSDGATPAIPNSIRR